MLVGKYGVGGLGFGPLPRWRRWLWHGRLGVGWLAGRRSAGQAVASRLLELVVCTVRQVIGSSLNLLGRQWMEKRGWDGGAEREKLGRKMLGRKKLGEDELREWREN